jgi:hypothetical protein
MNRKEVEEIAYKIRELTKRSDLFTPEVIETLSEAYYVIGELERRLIKMETAPFMYFVKYDMVNRSTDTWMRITDEFMEDQYRIREPILANLVADEIRRVHEKMVVYGTTKIPPTDREVAVRKWALEKLAELDEANENNSHFRKTDGE